MALITGALFLTYVPLRPLVRFGQGGHLKTVPELDGIRSLAIVPVMLSHTTSRITGGFLGVDLFFVLSGFLITSLLLSEHERTGSINLGHFFARRALRILPPLLVATVLAAAFWQKGDMGLSIAAALFFFANFLDWDTLGALTPTWSLSVEEQFYALWPALLCLIGVARRRAVPILFGVVIFACLLRSALYFKEGMDLDFLYRFTLTRMDTIAIGCLAAFLVRERSPDWAIGLYFVVICAGICFADWKHPLMLTVGFSVFAVIAAVFIGSVSLSDGMVRRFLACAPMRYIGHRSYGLYLYHVPVYAAVGVLTDGYVSPWMVPVKFACTLAVAELSYQTIEAYALSFRWRFRQDEPVPSKSLQPVPVAGAGH